MEQTAETGVTEHEGEPTLVVGDEPDGVRRARRFISDQLTSHGLGDLALDAALITSELVTNALLYAGPPAQVRLRLGPGWARLEVGDRSHEPPVRPRPDTDAMTGRGLHLVEGLASRWGVVHERAGKVVWAELEPGGSRGATLDERQLIALWAGDSEADEAASDEPPHTVELGEVPTDLLLAAKAHVDNLVREFTLAASGASTGATAQMSPQIAALVDIVVHRFAEPRQAIKRQALEAAASGRDHVHLRLHLPASAADEGAAYLHALDEADAYCRAARLLTLESPPQHRLFRQWYVGELMAQLHAAVAAGPDHVATTTETFEQRLLREIDRMAEAERRSERAARLHALTLALAEAETPEQVAHAALGQGVMALGASGGGVLLSGDSTRLSVPGTVGYDATVAARLRAESPDAELPAAEALRTGTAVWLESREERDARYPELAGLEPGTVSLCAVPLEVGGQRLGALRLSFAEGRLFDDEERAFLAAMAAQTAQALERTRLSVSRTQAAQRLQRNLLPPALPSAPGVDLSVAYRPLTASLDVGGDFYDVWRSGSRRLALAIGDVCGHGPEAAAVTALIRHTLRALTMTSTDPVAIMRQLDRALVDALRSSEAFSTVAFGFLSVTPDACWLDLVTGGHPGPVVLRRDGSTEVVELGGSLLGVLGDTRLEIRRIPLQVGDDVVLVTDGATDARDAEGRWFGIEGVAEAVRAGREAGTAPAEAVTAAVAAHTGGRLQDDLAVLAVRWNGGDGVLPRNASVPR